MQRYIYCYCVLGFAINWSERRVLDIVVMLAKLESAGRVSCMPVATRHYTNALYSGTLAQFRFLSLYWAELFFLSFVFFLSSDAWRETTYVVSVEKVPLNWYMVYICILEELKCAPHKCKCSNPGRKIETPNATYFVRKMCHTKRTNK